MDADLRRYRRSDYYAHRTGKLGLSGLRSFGWLQVASQTICVNLRSSAVQFSSLRALCVSVVNYSLVRLRGGDS